MQEEVLCLQGFSGSGETDQWDTGYTTASDIFHKLEEHQSEAAEVSAYDDREFFLEGEAGGNCFEPPKSAPAVPLKDERSMGYASLIKLEDTSGDGRDLVMDGPTGKMSTTAIKIVEEDNKPVVIKTENGLSGIRGRSSPWLTVLDARVTRLLKENFDVPVVSYSTFSTRNVKRQWKLEAYRRS